MVNKTNTTQEAFMILRIALLELVREVLKIPWQWYRSMCDEVNESYDELYKFRKSFEE